MRDLHRAAVTSIIAAAIATALALNATRWLAQIPERINPIALHERGLPGFGVTHPAIVAGRGPPLPLPALSSN